MAGLFSRIATTHGVTLEQIREYLVRRRTGLDAAVILSFAALYWFGATRLARRVCRRFPLGEGWTAALLAIVATATVVSVLGVMVGELWSGTIETFRIGSGHLSYRGERIPWSRHRFGLFVAGTGLFWLIAVLQYRAGTGGAGQCRD